MFVRRDRPEHTEEAEPVVVEYDGDQVTLTLDDGIVLTGLRSALAVSIGAHLDPSEGLREVA